MKNIIYILAFVLITASCKKDDSPSQEEQIIEIGNALAIWGGSNCKIISLNKNNILWTGPNSGGCSSIYFQFIINASERASYFDFKGVRQEMKDMGFEDWQINNEIFFREGILRKEDVVKYNLTHAITNSNCNIDNLLNEVNKIERTFTNNEIKNILSCLDNVEITKLVSQPE